MQSEILPFVQEGIRLEQVGPILSHPIRNPSEAIGANASYFGNREWAEEYLNFCHRDDTFRNRWLKAIGNYSDKIVVDIGCGPGNIFANFDLKPKLLIGVDVAPVSLEMAASHGYLPLLADATDLPFKSGFADIVVLNAALHHCENMESVLSEAARLVKPGGLLVTDHDPQMSAWNYKGIARLLWNLRLQIYRLMKKGFHKTGSQQYWGIASEIHHKPGHGVTKEFFHCILGPLGFEVNIYPHNHTNGPEVLEGKRGRAHIKYQLGNLFSGRNPFSEKSALSLMCVAKKKFAPT
jgi:ubiquinone/menaquinone biosynthesis C-methylase UbiE